MKTKKLKIAILSLTSCEGCQFAFLDFHEKFLEITKYVDIVEMRLVKENIRDKNKDGMDLSNIYKVRHFDIAFIEGSPITKENFKILKLIRKKSTKVIAMGTCAALGGIYHLKNYYPKDLIKQIYKHIKHIDNPKVLPIDQIIKVDHFLLGCPINGKEFYDFLYCLIHGKDPAINQYPVCYECQTRKYECALQKGEHCLGPITLGGCEAICLKSKMPCYGCRGLRENPEIMQMMKELEKNHSPKRIEQILEMFGVKDKIKKLSN